MPAQDLTTLAAAKQWAGITSSDSDVLIARLITQASRSICNVTDRPFFLPTTISEVLDGSGSHAVDPQRFPVLSLTSLSINGEAITEAPALVFNTAPQPGWVLDAWDGTIPGNAQRVTLRGRHFQRGQRNIALTYIAGYQVRGEAQTIPATGAATIIADQPLGRMGADGGVTLADGTALTKVTGVPATGQYAVDLASATYTFAIADAGQAVLLTYGFIPADIENACIELVGERFKYMDRMGIASKALGGQETVSFSLKSMPDYVRDTLANYSDPTVA